jgi:Fe-S cluster assembly protein SufD
MDLTNTVDLKETILAKYEDQAQKTAGALAVSLADRKKSAYNNFLVWGFPTTRHEEYKYTNFSAALKKDYSFEAGSALKESDLSSSFIEGLESNRLVFINGIYNSQLSAIAVSPAELEIKTLADADQELVKKYLGQEVYTSKDPFAELNTAFAAEGILIRVPRNKVVEAPVTLYFFTDATASDKFIQPRNLVIVEENAQASFVEITKTIGQNAGFSNSVTEVILQENSVTEYYKLQDDNSKSYLVDTTVVRLEGRSTFNAATISLNGAIIRNNLNIILNARNSEATFYGLTFSKDRQVIDNHTMVDHAVPDCVSNELYRSILDERSIGVFNGKIFVKPDAQKTNAYQSNKSVLLSREATMNTKPQLEIFADDVKCSHGATVGQLEKEPLFYLRARGMSEESARALLLVAFAQDIIDHIKIQPLQQFLTQAIEQRLTK